MNILSIDSQRRSCQTADLLPRLRDDCPIRDWSSVQCVTGIIVKLNYPNFIFITSVYIFNCTLQVIIWQNLQGFTDESFETTSIFHSWLIDFNGISNYLVLFYAKWLEKCVHFSFIITFFQKYFAHDIKYFYLKQIICTQLCGFKYFLLI